MFGTKQRKIEELQATVDVYGAALRDHHESMGSCDEALSAAWSERDALKARVAELEQKLIAVAHVAYRVPEVPS